MDAHQRKSWNRDGYYWETAGGDTVSTVGTKQGCCVSSARVVTVNGPPWGCGFPFEDDYLVVSDPLPRRNWAPLIVAVKLLGFVAACAAWWIYCSLV